MFRLWGAGLSIFVVRSKLCCNNFKSIRLLVVVVVVVVIDGGVAGGVVGIGVVVLVVLVVATSRKAVLSTSFSYQLYRQQLQH